MIQARIYDRENGVEHGGIVTDDGNIICGCCGALIEKDEISIGRYHGTPLDSITGFYGENDDSECSTDILEAFDTWVDLSDAIIGN